MKSLRMLGALLVAVFAFAVVGVSVASASEPEFKPLPEVSKRGFTFTSATSTLTAGANVVVCKNDHGLGEITGTDTVGNVRVLFTECTAGNGACPAHSPGLTNSIETVTLKGDLGTVKVGEAASLVGLLLEGGATSEFTTIEGTCLSPTTTKVTGKIVGEVKPVKKKQLLGSVTFALNGSEQKIREINELGKGFVEVPVLKAFGVASREESKEEIEFKVELEVT